jgi:hypothetical protein
MHRAPGRLWTCPGALSSPDARGTIYDRSRVVAPFWDFGWLPPVSRRYGEADPSAGQAVTFRPGFADGGVAA